MTAEHLAVYAEMRQWVETAPPDAWQTYPLLIDEARWLLNRLDKLEDVAKAAEGTRRAGRTPSPELDAALADLDGAP